MPVWQWLLDSAGAVLLVLLLFGLLLVLRRRVLSRHGGTFELSVREQSTPDGRGWVLGLGRYREDSLEWFRIFSPLPGPARAWRRNDLTVLSQRAPEGAEEFALYAGHVVVVCSDAARRGRARDEPQLAHRSAVVARGGAAGVAAVAVGAGLGPPGLACQPGPGLRCRVRSRWVTRARRPAPRARRRSPGSRAGRG